MYYPRQAVTRFSLDMSLETIQRSFTVTQGDTNRRWEVTLTNAGKPFEVPPTWTVALAGSLPSGHDLYENCIVQGGQIIFDFTGNAVSSQVGAIALSFDVFDEEGEVVASPKVWMIVTKSTRSFTDDLTLERLGLIQKFIAEIGEVDERLENLETADENITASVYKNTVNITKNAEYITRNAEAITNVAAAVTKNTGDIEISKKDIKYLAEKLTKGGTIRISQADWKNGSAKVFFPVDTFENGTITVIAPVNEATKAACIRSGISAEIDLLGLSVDVNVIVFTAAKFKPDEDLEFRYAILSLQTYDDPIAAMIGGIGGGGSDDLYVGSEEPPEDAKIWIDLNGEATPLEEWEFEMSDGRTVVKEIVARDKEE